MSEPPSNTTFDSDALYAALLGRLSGDITATGRLLVGEACPYEDAWYSWLTHLFPAAVVSGFAPHHEQFWDWVWALEPGTRPRPYVVYWPRGGAKSSSAELAVVAIGALRRRRYCLYVSGTQELADKHVSDIARRLESDPIARYYPALGEREVSKYGISRGWAGNRLRTAAGYMIDGIGLDAAVRGIKVGDYRPDLIIIDDIDHLKDKPTTVEEKIETLTQSILPAGSTDCAVLGAQNLIHLNSIFSRLAGASEYSADFLLDRIRTPVIPAIEGMATERQGDRIVIVAGTPVWAGQNLEECQGKIDTYGLRAFLRESQHEVEAPAGDLFDSIDFRHCTPEDVPALDVVEVWCDPAVTDTDQSDSNGIIVDGLAADGTIYRLWSWERRSSPDETLRMALLKALEYGASKLGVETNQGGDTWRDLLKALIVLMRQDGSIPAGAILPKYDSARAGASTGDKAHRASHMLPDYQNDRIVHVLGTHHILERALRRFPKTKPFDLVDASYWSWKSLADRRRVGGGFAPVSFESTNRWNI